MLLETQKNKIKRHEAWRVYGALLVSLSCSTFVLLWTVTVRSMLSMSWCKMLSSMHPVKACMTASRSSRLCHPFNQELSGRLMQELLLHSWVSSTLAFILTASTLFAHTIIWPQVIGQSFWWTSWMKYHWFQGWDPILFYFLAIISFACFFCGPFCSATLFCK